MKSNVEIAADHMLLLMKNQMPKVNHAFKYAEGMP